MNLSKTLRKKKKLGKKNQTRKHLQSFRSSGLGNIDPGDNFYQYVNQKWLSNTEIPSTKSAYGVSEEIEDKIDNEMNEVLQKCLEKEKATKNSTGELSSIEQMLGTFAQSVLTSDTQTSNLALTRQVLQSIESIQNKEEVAVVMGEFTRYKIRGVFTLYGQYENKNHTNYTYSLGIGKVGLPDPTYYFKRSMQRGRYFKLYKTMLEKIGKKFDLPSLPCIVKLERMLAGVLLNIGYDIPESQMSGKELQESFRHIPFSILFETIGLPSWQKRIFFIESKKWLHTLNKLYHHLGLDQWKLLLSLEFLLFALPWLPPEYSDISFTFFRKELRGQEKPLPPRQKALYVLQQYATPFFSQLYVEYIVDKSIKEEVIGFVKELLDAAQDRLKTLDWLEEKTREAAQEKVKHMKYLVAFPDSFEHHTIPKLQNNTLLANLLEMGAWQTDYEIHKLGQPLSKRKDWDDAVFVVNAYYYSQANEIILPAGILNPPFYDRHASLGWNYGGLGCIIGHEMTHAFDKEGKEYDPKGFQNQWWSLRDNRHYTELTKDLIDFYGDQKINGFPVSGRKTLSENIADIGGMAIALGALKKKLDNVPLTQEQRKKAFQEFFISYAISWRIKEKRRKRVQALLLDKHAPPILRVNLVVSQFQEWYDAFDIQPKDALYIKPEKRIHIL